MKTLISILLLGVAGSSCTRYVYQVTKLEYQGENQGESPNITAHEDVTITYQFWHDDGVMTYSVNNNTDEMIILDFTRSSFIIGNRAIPYKTGIVESNVELYEAPLNNPATYVGTVRTPSFPSPRIGIPPKTEVIVDNIAIPIPLAPTRLPGSTQNINRTWTPGPEQNMIRHYLCYTVKTNDAEPIFISDSFQIASAQVMSRPAFNSFSLTQNVEQDPMTSFLIKQDLENTGSESAASIGVTMAILAVTGLVVVLITANGDE